MHFQEDDITSVSTNDPTPVSPADDPSPSRSRFHELMRRPFDVRSIALTGLFILALFYTMYFMRSVLLPLVLALLLSYLLRPIVRAYKLIHIPAPVGAAIVLLTLVGVVVYGLSFLAAPAAGWLEKAPYSLSQLQSKLIPLQQPLQQVSKASGEIEKLAAPATPGSKSPAVEVKTHPIADVLYVRTPEVAMSAVLLIILLYFL
ncbi:MAG: hypothetical protein DME57_10875, partial [Verrucomicrobia bacterium]